MTLLILEILNNNQHADTMFKIKIIKNEKKN